MSDPLVAHLDWLQRSFNPRLAELVQIVPIDVGEYEETLWAAGFVLPPSLRQLLSSHGLVHYPDFWGEFPGWGRSTSGLLMEDAAGLFDNHLHALSEESAGVAQGGRWLVFATMRGDLDGAYALDRRFRDAGELGVGTYHQDSVCHEPRADGEPLWDAEPSFGRWLESFFAAVQQGLESIEPRKVSRRIDSLQSARGATRREASWSEHWAALQGRGHPWTYNEWATYRGVLRATDDMAVIEAIVAQVQADLDGKKGRKVVPGLSLDAKSGHWTTGMPGPVDLVARLPEHGPWGRRDLMRWAIERCSDDPPPPVVEALALLRVAIEPAAVDEEHRRRVVRRCAELGWDGPEAVPSSSDSMLARAAAWALTRPDTARVAHVLTLAHDLRHRDTGSMELSARRMWSRLVRVVTLGPDAVVESAKPEATPVDAEVAEFSAWLEGLEGTQRERLAAVESQWMPRLRGRPAVAREQAAAIVRRAITSKKLVEARDALLLSLVGEP
ncbi:MAG: hypothetical protein AAF799_00545 [Myxococcota bacterium]